MRRLIGLWVSILLCVCINVKAAPLAVHASAGRIIGEKAESPVEAFLVGALSHLCMDIAPYHQAPVDWYGNWQKESPVIALEAAGTLANVYKAYKARDHPNALWGVAGAIAPEVIDAAIAVTTKRQWYSPVHSLFPKYVDSPRLTREQSVAFEVLLLSISLRF